MKEKKKVLKEEDKAKRKSDVDGRCEKWSKNIIDVIMYFSFQERKKREYRLDKMKYEQLKSMTDEQLTFEYINTKTKYEYKKNVFTLFLITIVLSVIMNVWKYFFNFLNKALQFASMYQENVIDVMKIGFIIAIIIVLSIKMVILMILLVSIRQLYLLYKYLLLIKEIRGLGKNKTIH